MPKKKGNKSMKEQTYLFPLCSLFSWQSRVSRHTLERKEL